MTVAAELAKQVGAQIRYCLKIEGLEPIFWDRRDRPSMDGAMVGADPPGPFTSQDPSLLALWRCNEVGAGDLADELGNHTATQYGTVSVQTGPFGGARGVFSSANYFRVTDARRLHPQRITVAAWVNPRNATQIQYAKVAVHEHATLTKQAWAIQTNATDNTMQCTLTMTDGSNYGADDTAPLSILSWHLIGFTFDADAGIFFFRDGQLVDTDATAIGKTIDYDGSDIWFGKDGNAPAVQNYNGWITTLGIWGESKSREWWRRSWENRGWSRSGLCCLQLPEQELSSGINLKELKADVSSLQVCLDNIPDPTDRGEPKKYYFAKCFAPGRTCASDVKVTNLRRPTAGAVQVDADATTLYVQNNDAWPSFGKLVVGRETCSYSGRGSHAQTGFPTGKGQTIDTFTGVVRGLYPALTAANQGRTYAYPIQDDLEAGDVGAFQVVSSEPFSLIGREAGIYAVPWDPANGKWFDESAAKLVFPGQITEELQWESDGNRFSLTLEHIMKRLERKVGRHFPKAYVDGINLNGDKGRSFVIHEVDISGTLIAEANCVLPANYYSLEQVIKGILDEVNNPSSWTNVGGTHSANAGMYIYVGSNGRVIVHALPYDVANRGWWYIYPRISDSYGGFDFCHAWQALGFSCEDPIDIRTYKVGGKGEIEAPDLPWWHYHPAEDGYNGLELRAHWKANDAPWDDQGDYGAARAFFLAKDQPTRGAGRETGLYLAMYSAKATAADPTKGYEYTLQPSMGQGSIGDLARSPLGFIGSQQKDEPVELESVYIPAYLTTTEQGWRGPIEQLLYPLISSGTQDYNASSYAYDKLPLALSVHFPEELVDVPSFLQWDAFARAAYADLAARPLYVIAESLSWLELWRREAQLWGLVAIWDQAQGKLSCVSVVSPETHLQVTTIDMSNRGREEYPDVSIGIRNVCNQWEVAAQHSLQTNKARLVATYNDQESQQGLDAIISTALKHPGLKSGAVDGTKKLIQHLTELFSNRAWLLRYAQQIVPVSLAPREETRVFAGEVVKYTSDWHPDPHGSGQMSVSNLFALVLNAGWSLYEHTGSAELLIFSQATEPPPWAYAALVDITATNGGWDATNKRLTLVALQFGEAGDPDDGGDIKAGHTLNIIESAPINPASPQTWGVTVNKDYETDGAQLLTLDPGTTLSGWDPDVEYFVVPADYTIAVADQKARNLWQADSLTQLLYGSVAAQLYG